LSNDSQTIVKRKTFAKLSSNSGPTWSNYRET